MRQKEGKRGLTMYTILVLVVLYVQERTSRYRRSLDHGMIRNYNRLSRRRYHGELPVIPTKRFLMRAIVALRFMRLVGLFSLLALLLYFGLL